MKPARILRWLSEFRASSMLTTSSKCEFADYIYVRSIWLCIYNRILLNSSYPYAFDESGAPSFFPVVLTNLDLGITSCFAMISTSFDLETVS